MGGAVPVGCGQCLPCRINRRREWTIRQTLESYTHESNSFVTLTYDEEKLPPGGVLDASELRNFIKRLRARVAPLKVRFFAVGEYGDKSWRPHYHLSLFGLGPLDQLVITDCWKHGFVSVYEFNYKTAAYVGGYVTKKLTKKGDPRLGGRPPEFARMSNRPGIGADAMLVVRDSVLTDAGLDYYTRESDVFREVRFGGKKYGLGRYLRRRLREEIGVSEEDEKKRVQLWINETQKKMLPLQADAISAGEGLSISALYARSRNAKILQVEAREKINDSRGKTL